MEESRGLGGFGQHVGRLALLVGDGGIDALGQEELDHLDVATPGGAVQGSVAQLILLVKHGVLCEDHLDSLCVSATKRQ